jgi:hypothetical protein
MAIQIQHRRDNSYTWTSVNPVLAQGEMGWEIDCLRMKIGNGSTSWTCLPYWTGTPYTGECSVKLTAQAFRLWGDVGACTTTANYLYGTDGSGVKGWYPQPCSGGSSYSFTDSVHQYSGTCVHLMNDCASPGGNYYYGTNSCGTKGWYSLATGGSYSFVDSVSQYSGTCVHLVNDASSPGAYQYYSTDCSGVKGWRPISVTSTCLNYLDHASTPQTMTVVTLVQ